MRRVLDTSSWYIPWGTLQEVIDGIRRADGERDMVLERAREAAREARENEED